MLWKWDMVHKNLVPQKAPISWVKQNLSLTHGQTVGREVVISPTYSPQLALPFQRGQWADPVPPKTLSILGPFWHAKCWMVVNSPPVLKSFALVRKRGHLVNLSSEL